MRGYWIGGGLAVAAACELRIAAPSARLGVPIAQTLGNGLAMPTFALLADHLGMEGTLDLLPTARMLTVNEAHAAGFVTRLAVADSLGAETAELTDRLAEHARSAWGGQGVGAASAQLRPARGPRQVPLRRGTALPRCR